MRPAKHACALDGDARRAVIEVARVMARGTPALVAVTGSRGARRNDLAALLHRNFDLEMLRGAAERQSPDAALRQMTASGKAVCIVAERDALSPEVLSRCDLVLDTDSGQIARRTTTGEEKPDTFFAPPSFGDHSPYVTIEKGSDPHGTGKE